MCKRKLFQGNLTTQGNQVQFNDQGNLQKPHLDKKPGTQLRKNQWSQTFHFFKRSKVNHFDKIRLMMSNSQGFNTSQNYSQSSITNMTYE